MTKGFEVRIDLGELLRVRYLVTAGVPASARSDVFALGAVGYFLLAGFDYPEHLNVGVELGTNSGLTLDGITLDDNVTGTRGRQHAQPMSTVSRPVGRRWIRLGAIAAPRRPPRPRSS